MARSVPADRRIGGDAAQIRRVTLPVELRAATMADDDGRVMALIAEVLDSEMPRDEDQFQFRFQALADLFHELRRMAITDELTQVRDRRGFFRTAGKWLDAAACKAHGVRLAYVGVDDWERINRSGGRRASDPLLRHTAEFLRRTFPEHRTGDLIGRLGDDEFAVLTVARDQSGPDELVRTVLDAWASAGSSRTGTPTCLSIGVAERAADGPDVLMDLCRRAQKAMYVHRMMKSIGRDCAPIH